MDIQHEFHVTSLKELRDKQKANQIRIEELKKRIHNNQLHPLAGSWNRVILAKQAENWRTQSYLDLHA